MNDKRLDFRDEELLAAVVADLIGDVRHVAVGNASPIPATASLLARARGKGRPYVSLLGSQKHTFWTDGGRELFDCAGQGRIDVFFLSGGEIDGQGNINLVSIGARMHSLEEAVHLVELFLATPFSEDPRHQRRIDMVADYEKTGILPS